MIEEAMQGGDKTSKDTQTQVVQETGSEEQGSEETGGEEEDKPRTARDRRRRE